MTKTEEKKLRELLEQRAETINLLETKRDELGESLTKTENALEEALAEVEEQKKKIEREEGYYKNKVEECTTLQRQLDIVNGMLDAFPNPPPRIIKMDDYRHNDVILDVPARLSSWLANNLHPTRKG